MAWHLGLELESFELVFDFTGVYRVMILLHVSIRSTVDLEPLLARVGNILAPSHALEHILPLHHDL